MNSLMIAWHLVVRSIGRKKSFVVYLLMPCVVVSVIIMSITANNSTKIAVQYTNLDDGAAGKYVIQELARNDAYELREIANEAELKEAVINKKGSVGILIPADYTNQVLQGSPPEIEVYEIMVNEASIVIDVTLENAVRRLVATTTDMQANGSGFESNRAVLDRIVSDTRLSPVSVGRIDLELTMNSNMYQVTGLTLLFMMALITSTVSLIYNDRRNRTMQRIFSTPVRAYEMTLGYFLGSFFVGILQILFILIFSRYVIGFDYNIPFITHFIILAAFMLVAIGIASAVSGLIRNPNHVGILNSFIIVPTCMLGGCFWPLAVMPEVMQKVSNFVPQKWVIEAVERSAGGSSLSEIWLPLSILGVMAICLLAVGSVILRPQEPVSS